MFKVSRIRVSDQLEVEQVVIDKNCKRFILVYKSLLFSTKVIKKIEMFGKTK